MAAGCGGKDEVWNTWDLHDYDAQMRVYRHYAPAPFISAAVQAGTLVKPEDRPRGVTKDEMNDLVGELSRMSAGDPSAMPPPI